MFFVFLVLLVFRLCICDPVTDMQTSLVDTSNTNYAVGTVDNTSIVSLLETAKPGTWLYQKIISSTPVLAGEIFTQHLTVKSRRCVYMESEVPVVLSSSSSASSSASVDFQQHHYLKPASFSNISTAATVAAIPKQPE